jgi:hypothetical protein
MMDPSMVNVISKRTHNVGFSLEKMTSWFWRLHWFHNECWDGCAETLATQNFTPLGSQNIALIGPGASINNVIGS